MRKEIYFDNAATTKPFPEVAEEVMKGLERYYNPSAIYGRSVEISKQIEAVRKEILRVISAEKGSLIFTSGGTESINWAIRSSARMNKNIITTSYEHDATIKTMEDLSQNGYQVIYIDPQEGRIRKEDILEKVDEKTALVSLVHVNNETGHIIDLERSCRAIKNKNPKTIIHIDAVQSFMKRPIDVESYSIDLLSISGHKIHGIKGTGALYIKYPEKMKPMLFGGGQEQGLRSGTENVAGILALGKAVEIGRYGSVENAKHLADLKRYFLQRLTEISSIEINSPEDGADHILNVSFLGVPSEIMLHSLEEQGIYVSSGSACSAKKKGSRVLEVLRLKDNVRGSAIRFSFSIYNTREEIDPAIEALKKIVPEIRMLTRFKG